MLRMGRLVVTLLFAVSLLDAGRTWGDSSTGPSTGVVVEAAVSTLITDLSDADASVREAARDKLVHMGPAIRPALRKASQGKGPQLRGEIAKVMRQLPWAEPSDPPAVRTLLEGYGERDLAERQEAAIALARIKEVGRDALLRMLVQESDPRVGWTIVQGVQETQTPQDLLRLQSFEPPENNGPALVLVGWAWEKKNYSRALDLYERAFAIPSTARDEQGESNYAFNSLSTALKEKRRFPRLMELLRVRCAASSAAVLDRVESANPLQQLFGLHAQAGPLPGLGGDVVQYASRLSRPQVLYSLGKIRERIGDRWLSGALYWAAFLATTDESIPRFQVGEFLVSHGWPALAEVELREALRLSDGRVSWEVIQTHFDLSVCRAMHGDNATAASELRMGLAHLEGHFALSRLSSHGPESGDEAANSIRALMHCYALRAARQQKQPRAMMEHAEAIAKLGTGEADVVLEAVPVLEENGQAAEAKELFEKSYQLHRAWLDQRPADAQRMNQLAWLAARCGQRLEEALVMANRAMATMPDNAGWIDTAAEVNYRLHRVDEAIRLETRAQELEPQNPFIKEQLERFRSGK